MLGGMIAWAIQFTIIYGVTSTVCAHGWADATVFGIGIVQATVVLTTLAAFGATAVVLVVSMRDRSNLRQQEPDETEAFINHATFLISALSLVTIAWHGLPAFILPACS
jgi:hypothetical protein